MEVFFFDTGVAGIARASFTVVVAEEDKDDTDDTDGSGAVAVPDTGAFTGMDGSVEVASFCAIVLMVLALMIKVLELKMRR